MAQLPLVKIILMQTMQARSYMIEKMCVFVWGGGSIINSKTVPKKCVSVLIKEDIRSKHFICKYPF